VPSLTRTVTAKGPVCVAVGVQAMSPEAGSIVMPGGGCTRLNVSVSPASGSSAWTSYT
jgi:hypothetical protein